MSGGGDGGEGRGRGPSRGGVGMCKRFSWMIKPDQFLNRQNKFNTN